MISQSPYTEPRQEMQSPPPVQTPVPAPREVEPMQAQYQYPYQYALYDERFMDALAQRLVPRLKSLSPIATPGQRLALAIVSLALMIPLIAILLAAPVIEVLGFWGALIGLGLVCGTVIAVNGTFSVGFGSK